MAKRPCCPLLICSMCVISRPRACRTWRVPGSRTDQATTTKIITTNPVTAINAAWATLDSSSRPWRLT